MENPFKSMDTDEETETPVVEEESNEAGIVGEVADLLSSQTDDIQEETAKSDMPKAKTPNIVDINNLSISQIQDLQELFANTPRRTREATTYHTVGIRTIDGKFIVEWGNSYLDLKTDSTLRKDVLKTMIPVRFHTDTSFVDIMWKEEFMSAKKVDCKIVNIDRKEYPQVVGTTLKRNPDGGQTSQEVEMYVNKVDFIYTIQLPNGAEVKINSLFVN